MTQRQILKQAQSDVRAGKERRAVFETYHTQIKNPDHLATAIASVAHAERKEKYKGLNLLLALLLFLAAGTTAFTALFIALATKSLAIGLGVFLLGIIVPVVMAIGVLRYEGQVYGFLLIICGINLLNTLLKFTELGVWILIEVAFLAAIISLAWLVKSKLFPNLGLFKVKKDASGQYDL